MSNVWEAEEPQDYSGFGTEFFLETNSDSDWPINTLRSLMAFNILVATGHYGDKPLVDYGDRIPMVIEPNISCLMVVEPKNVPNSFELISGRVDLLQITGITQQELGFAKEDGSEALSSKIYASEGSYIINPERLSVI